MAGETNGPIFPVVDLPSASISSPEAVVNYMVGQLVVLGHLRPEDVAGVTSQVLLRESLGSTAIGKGIAIPHCSSEAVKEVVGLLGRSSMTVRWPGALDELPVHGVCLLVGPAKGGLRALEVLGRKLQGPNSSFF